MQALYTASNEVDFMSSYNIKWTYKNMDVEGSQYVTM